MSDHEIDLQRRRVAEMKGAMERRAVSDTSRLELRDDADEFLIYGYASTFNETYDLGAFKERVAPKAFDRTLRDLPDVVFTVDHGASLSGLPLARTRTAKGGPGTLVLHTDDHGLAFTARLERDDPDAQALVRAIRSGRMSKSSFAFRVNRDSWDDSTNTRTLEDLSLHHGDVSCVAFPANEATAISVRLRIPGYGERERETLASWLWTPNYGAREREQLALRAASAGSPRRVSSPARPDLPDPEWYHAQISAMRRRSR